MISTPRFVLRPLIPDDATERYSGWFEDKTTSSYIAGARSPHDVPALRAYIEARAGRADVLFLGIFLGNTNEHIGNVKYEPVNAREGYAVMGILIGEVAWRGRGVAEEVIRASARWLKENRGINDILLGVARDHRGAIAAYERIGFVQRRDPRLEPPDDAICMVWHVSLPGSQNDA